MPKSHQRGSTGRPIAKQSLRIESGIKKTLLRKVARLLGKTFNKLVFMYELMILYGITQRIHALHPAAVQIRLLSSSLSFALRAACGRSI